MILLGQTNTFMSITLDKIIWGVTIKLLVCQTEKLTRFPDFKPRFVQTLSEPLLQDTWFHNKSIHLQNR
jgi:hypothetical protein